MSKAIKKTVNQFIRSHSLSVIDYAALKTAAEALGYTVIEFNNIFNDPDVETVINNLKLDDAVSNSRGFTYADSNYRLLFVNEDLNNDEKLLILSHELGHIVCGHFSTAPIIGKDVQEEHEANEFSHYLLNQNSVRRLRLALSNHRKTATVVTALAIATALFVSVWSMIKKEQSYYGEYYITNSGDKYHKKDCIFTKDKNSVKRLTIEEFEQGIYEACDMCLPDKQ